MVGRIALVFIEEILIVTDGTNEILHTLKQYSNGESKVAQFAKYRQAYQYLRLREYDKGVEIMKATEFCEENTGLRQGRLYDMGVAYYHLLDQKEEAYYYFNELLSTYPDCHLARITRVFYYGDGYGYKGISDKYDEIDTPTETKLFANYLNPFNPTTVIKYQIVNASQVSLKVYDVMGREIATLVNSFQNQGAMM